MNCHARRPAAWFLPLLLLPAALAGCGPPPERPAALLLITIDTLRTDHLSSEGYPLPTTPFLDELGSEGWRFRNAYTPIPRTTQALITLLSGKYPHSHGVRVLFGRLDEEQSILSDWMKDAGYRTVAVVTNRILIEKRGLDTHFDVYDYAPDVRGAAETTAAALQHMGAIPEGEKLFLWVHYIDPHVPYYPPDALADAFDPDYTGRYARSFGDVPGGTGNHAYPKDLPKPVAVFQNPLPPEVNAHIRKLYAADIRATDDALSELVGAFRRRYGSRGAIAFTSDHGESLGEHDYFYDHGDYVYEPTLRVPLFVIPAGETKPLTGTVDDPVSLVDVAPTLAEMFALEVPAGDFDGRSLAPYLRGESLPPRPLFAECGRSFYPELVRRRVNFDIAGRFRAVIDDGWKLIWTPGLPEESAYELYDLGRDPGETEDLFRPDHPRVPGLRRSLQRWVADDRSSGQTEDPSEEDLRHLRSLGYVD